MPSSRFFAGAAVCLLIAGMRAYACSCTVPSAPACEAAWRPTAVVFTGTVKAIEVPPFPTERILPEKIDRTPVEVRLLISEWLAGQGPQVGDIEIRTGQGGGDCGYAFEVGATYIVYASRSQAGALTTGICSRTRPIDKAHADLDYFHGIATAKPAGSVYGIAAEATREPSLRHGEDDMFVGLPDVAVTLEGDGITRAFQTSDDGRFRFDDLPPGEYRVAAARPGYSLSDAAPKTYNVALKGCAYVLFYFQTDRRIHGRVLDRRGEPVTKAFVQLVPTAPRTNNERVPSWAAFVTSETDGSYEMKNLGDGEYYLGVNLVSAFIKDSPYPRTFYPGVANITDAKRIRIGSGAEQHEADIVVPDALRPRMLSGVVVWPDGRPAPNVEMFLEDPHLPWSFRTVRGRTDDAGRFQIEGFTGVDCYVRAIHYPTGLRPDAQTAEPFLIRAGDEPVSDLRLVLNIPGDEPPSARARENRVREQWRRGEAW